MFKTILKAPSFTRVLCTTPKNTRVEHPLIAGSGKGFTSVRRQRRGTSEIWGGGRRNGVSCTPHAAIYIPSPPFSSISDSGPESFHHHHHQQDHYHHQQLKDDDHQHPSPIPAGKVLEKFTENTPLEDISLIFHKPHDFNVCEERLLGIGTFAVVKYGTMIHPAKPGTRIPVAIKEYQSFVHPERAVLEGKILSYLSKLKFVPRVYGLIREEAEDANSNPGMKVVMQAVNREGFTLQNYLRGDMKEEFEEKTWLRICLEMIHGMELLHQHRILFNDFKPDNLIYSEKENKLYFIDFGSASYVREDSGVQGSGEISPKETCQERDRQNFAKRNFMHIAPEVRMRDERSFKSDIYSLGYCLKVIGQHLAQNPLTAMIGDVNRIAHSLLHLGADCMDHKARNRPDIQSISEQISSLSDELNVVN